VQATGPGIGPTPLAPPAIPGSNLTGEPGIGSVSTYPAHASTVSSSGISEMSAAFLGM
jgi:hypothetical protein